MNNSVFGGSLWILLLAVILGYLTVGFLKKTKKNFPGSVKNNQGLAQIAFVTVGYFLVVAKTALLNAEEANRYELPIYGFCMMLMVAAVYYLLADMRSKVSNIVGIVFVVGILLAQGLALKQGKVQFLYQEDAANVAWAAEHKDSVVVYLYNPNNVWMIWDESEELMQYDKIFFVNLADETLLEDEELLNAEEIYVYTSRMDQAEAIMEGLIEDNPNVSKREQMRQLLYCDLYYLN